MSADRPMDGVDDMYDILDIEVEFFKTKLKLDALCDPIGSAEAGDPEHLTLGARFETLLCCTVLLGATHRQHPPQDGNGATEALNKDNVVYFVPNAFSIECPLRSAGDEIKLMDWFHPSFPELKDKGVERFLTGYEACDLAKPFVKKSNWEGLSVLEVLMGQGCSGVGKATRFFSHCQAEPVLDTLFAIFGDKRLFTSDALYFLDVVSIRQLLKGDFKPESVSTAIESIGHTVLMCYPNDDPVAMQRLWCVFEIAATVIKESNMHCAPEAPHSSDFNEFLQHLKRSADCMRNVTVDLSKCKSRDPADKEMIMDAVEEDRGVEETSAIVQEIIRNSAQTYEQKACELFGLDALP